MCELEHLYEWDSEYCEVCSSLTEKAVGKVCIDSSDYSVCPVCFARARGYENLTYLHYKDITVTIYDHEANQQFQLFVDSFNLESFKDTGDKGVVLTYCTSYDSENVRFMLDWKQIIESKLTKQDGRYRLVMPSSGCSKGYIELLEVK